MLDRFWLLGTAGSLTVWFNNCGDAGQPGKNSFFSITLVRVLGSKFNLALRGNGRY